MRIPASANSAHAKSFWRVRRRPDHRDRGCQESTVHL